jgi:ABC-2 type transport system ATP-binding protein
MIEAQNLQKRFIGGVEAVRGIDLEVAPGEVFGLLGPNGAGKSTTVGMLTTTVLPTAGSARVGGFDVVSEALAARSASSVVFQEAVVDRALSGRRNCEIHARLWGIGRSRAAARIDELAETFGLTDIVDRPVSTYSGGERRRLEIARALISEPRVLFLDEPTVGLDPLIRYELLDLIGTLRASSDMTVLLTTHYLDEAQRLCDRVAIMHRGEVIATGTPSELTATFGREVVEVRLAANGAAALDTLKAHGIAHADAFAIGSTVMVPSNGRAGAEIIASIDQLGLNVLGLAARQPTLDDVYVRLTGDPVAA